MVSYSNFLAAKYGIRKPFRHEVFFAAASDSYGSTGPSMLVRKNGWKITDVKVAQDFAFVLDKYGL